MTEVDASRSPIPCCSRNMDREAGNGGTTLLAEAAADLMQPVYYLCGAPGFIESCFKSLVESGTPEADIKFEVFRGYG